MKFQYKKTLLYTLMMCSTAIIMATKSFPSHQKALESSDPLEHSKPYQWSKIYNVTDDPNASEGHQVLHFSSNKNRPYQENQYAIDFVNQYCSNAKQFKTDADVLRFASDQVTLKGNILEMGTGAAKTTNFLAALNPTRKIHTFDSYTGLPEEWDKGSGRIIAKGSFALINSDSDYLPPVLNNVEIFVGEFKKTLPRYKEEILKDSSIPFINIDSDIYESAKTVFDILGDNIVSETILHFDEFYNYPKYLKGEFKAFQEFVQRKGYNFEVLAFNTVHEQVVVKIKDYIS